VVGVSTIAQSLVEPVRLVSSRLPIRYRIPQRRRLYAVTRKVGARISKTTVDSAVVGGRTIAQRLVEPARGAGPVSSRRPIRWSALLTGRVGAATRKVFALTSST